jgi:hypothetical protein
MTTRQDIAAMQSRAILLHTIETLTPLVQSTARPRPGPTGPRYTATDTATRDRTTHTRTYGAPQTPHPMFRHLWCCCTYSPGKKNARDCTGALGLVLEGGRGCAKVGAGNR